MTVAIVITTVVCIINVWLYLTIKILAPIEKLAYWLMSNILSKLTATLISLNLNLLVMDHSLEGFYCTLITGAFFDSINICWIISILYDQEISTPRKVLFIVILVSGMVAVDQGLVVAGYVRLITWTSVFSLARYVFIIVLIFLFSIVFKRMLIRVR